MACQHREAHLRLEDTEKLQLYAKSAISKHHTLDNALVKAKARSKHWEWEAKAGVETTTSVLKERDEAKKEAQIARLVTVATGDAKERVEDDLARVQATLTITEEARRKVEVEDARLEVEQTSIMLEIGATKDEVFSL